MMAVHIERQTAHEVFTCPVAAVDFFLARLMELHTTRVGTASTQLGATLVRIGARFSCFQAVPALLHGRHAAHVVSLAAMEIAVTTLVLHCATVAVHAFADAAVRGVDARLAR